MAHTEADRSRCVGQPGAAPAGNGHHVGWHHSAGRRSQGATAPAVAQPPSLLSSSANSALSSDVEARKTELLREINQRNLGYFEQVQKLDAWADDLKLGLEQEIKEIDRQIKEVRTAATAPTLEEKLSWQKKQRELEGKRSKLRRDLFSRQDEVEAQRNGLIGQLELQLQQQVEEHMLFTIEWELK